LTGEALLDYRVLREFGSVSTSGESGIMKRTIDLTSYVSLPMFDARIHFVAAGLQKHIECEPSTLDSACDAQLTFVRLTTLRWYGWPAQAPAVYTPETEVTFGRGGASDSGQQRMHNRNYMVIDAGGDYLVLPKRDYDQDGQVIVTRTDYFYDGSRDI